MTKFTLGTKVIRTIGGYHKIKIGDIGTITEVNPRDDEQVRIKEYPGPGYHYTGNLEVLEPASELKQVIEKVVQELT